MIFFILAALCSLSLIYIWLYQAVLLAIQLGYKFPQLNLIETVPPTVWPKLSVIITAKDEEAKIETSVNRLTESTYQNLEIIVVNDRSVDKTGEILERLSQKFPQLKVIHLTDLPKGWLGKCHACWKGASEATGEWLLFMDGDVHLAPDAIERAISYAESKQLDHLTSIPELLTDHPFEEGFISVFFQLLWLNVKPHGKSSPKSKWGAGIGAFNLVKKSAYTEVGGHASIKLEIADDVMLGTILRRRGFKQDIVSGRKLITVRWRNGLRDTIKGLEKNLFSGFSYSIPKGIFYTICFVFVQLCPIFFAILRFPFSDILLITYFVSLAAIYTAQSWTTGFPKWIFILHPISISLMIYAGWKSMFVTLKQGGVRWRDTFYPLSELREAAKRSSTN